MCVITNKNVFYMNCIFCHILMKNFYETQKQFLCLGETANFFGSMDPIKLNQGRLQVHFFGWARIKVSVCFV